MTKGEFDTLEWLPHPTHQRVIHQGHEDIPRLIREQFRTSPPDRESRTAHGQRLDRSAQKRRGRRPRQRDSRAGLGDRRTPGTRAQGPVQPGRRRSHGRRGTGHNGLPSGVHLRTGADGSHRGGHRQGQEGTQKIQGRGMRIAVDAAILPLTVNLACLHRSSAAVAEYSDFDARARFPARWAAHVCGDTDFSAGFGSRKDNPVRRGNVRAVPKGPASPRRNEVPDRDNDEQK